MGWDTLQTSSVNRDNAWGQVGSLPYRQGHLFDLAIKALVHAIRQLIYTQGIKTGDQEIKLAHSADEILLFLSKLEQLSTWADGLIGKFDGISGHSTWSKSEAMPLFRLAVDVRLQDFPLSIETPYFK